MAHLPGSTVAVSAPRADGAMAVISAVAISMAARRAAGTLRSSIASILVATVPASGKRPVRYFLDTTQTRFQTPPMPLLSSTLTMTV